MQHILVRRAQYNVKKISTRVKCHIHMIDIAVVAALIIIVVVVVVIIIIIIFVIIIIIISSPEPKAHGEPAK